MKEELKNKLWKRSKPAKEWVKSYLVIPVLDAIDIIENEEKKKNDN